MVDTTTTHTTEFFVKSYDEGADTFEVLVDPGLFDVDEVEISGCVLPMVIGEFGDPFELVGNTFTRPMV